MHLDITAFVHQIMSRIISHTTRCLFRLDKPCCCRRCHLHWRHSDVIGRCPSETWPLFLSPTSRFPIDSITSRACYFREAASINDFRFCDATASSHYHCSCSRLYTDAPVRVGQWGSGNPPNFPYQTFSLAANTVWRSRVVVSALASINEVNLRRARLVLRWATVSGFSSRCRTLISVCNQPATQGQLSLSSLRGR